METKLERISQLSKENSKMVFTSVGHFINKELLKECHESMGGNKAAGIVRGMPRKGHIHSTNFIPYDI